MITTVQQPCAELSPGAAVRFTLKWQMVGLLLMVSHVLLVRQSLVLAPLAILGAAWLYANAPLAGFVVFLQILLYQNWIIGLLSTGMDRDSTFVVLQGTNFSLIVIMAIIAWTRVLTPKWHTLRPILFVVMLAIVVAVAYTLFGSMKAGFVSASTYFRNTTAMLFAVIVGLDLGRIYGYRTIAMAFLVSVAFSMLLGYVEALAPESYYDATNATSFMAIKNSNDPRFSTFFSAKDIVQHNTATLFNITGSESTISQLRFQGTVMHPISYAYVLAAAGLVAWSIGQTGWLWLLVPLLVLTGVKGAVLMFFSSIILWTVWSLSRSKQFLAIVGTVMMVMYVGFGLTFGAENGDFHVLGFMGGWNGFLADPLGHGIGVGGNLSGQANAGFQWKEFQRGGSSDFALESAVGVLLYQMGVASVAVFAVFVMLLWKAPFQIPAYGRRLLHRHSLMFIVLATVAVNGVFQEEAYAPTAAGIFTLLCAVIIANGNRPTAGLSLWQPNGTIRTAHV